MKHAADASFNAQLLMATVLIYLLYGCMRIYIVDVDKNYNLW